MLQWGRDRMIAEIGGATLAEQKAARLQWGRDRMIAEIAKAGDIPGRKVGFNGAAIG